MAKAVDVLRSWLNRTLDREFWFIRLLEEHAKQVEMTDPDLSEELIRRRNTESTHARMLGDEVAALGGKQDTTGAVEDLAEKIIWGAQEQMANDSDVRHLLDEWTAEQDLIGRLTAVVSAARAREQSEIAARMEAVLAEKRGTAAWLEETLAEQARNFLNDIA